MRSVASPADAGTRLDKFLAHPDRLGSRRRAAEALERGRVSLNDQECGLDSAARPIVAGDVVRVWTDKPNTARPALRAGRRGDLDIVFEDRHLIAINKPPGLLTVPLERRPDADSAQRRIELHLRSWGRLRPLAVHRIDQDTSGVVLFAKDPDARAAVQRQFRRREPTRVYWAVVRGVPQPAAGRWADDIAWDERALIQRPARPGDPLAEEAVCHYQLVEAFADTALLEVSLESGRRNQIRVQAMLHGHPIVGERRYVDDGGEADRIRFGRYALHARRLTFRHPADDREIALDAPPPPDFLDLLDRLRRQR